MIEAFETSSMLLLDNWDVFNDGVPSHVSPLQVQPQSAVVEVLGHPTNQSDEIVELLVNSLTYQVCLQCLQYLQC
jgi:hypothetical protein